MRHEIRVDKTRDMSCDGCLLTRYFALLSKLIINFSFFILNYFPCYLCYLLTVRGYKILYFISRKDAKVRSFYKLWIVYC